MATLVIWGEDDHQNRAKALATTYNTTAQKISDKPKKLTDLDTLVFWGHGDPSAFCSLDSDAFLDLISSWKKLNSKLRTVEMLTCNARHRQGGYTDAYTEQVVKKVTTKHSDIKFKALPIATTRKGDTCQFSILKWHPASATWAYIGAPGGDDKGMWAAAAKLEDQMPPRGKHVGYLQAFAVLGKLESLTANSDLAVKYKYDKARLDQYNLELRSVKESSYIYAGTIGTLRWCLTDIR